MRKWERGITPSRKLTKSFGTVLDMASEPLAPSGTTGIWFPSACRRPGHRGRYHADKYDQAVDNFEKRWFGC